MFNQFKVTQLKQSEEFFNMSKKFFGKNEKVIKNRMKSVSSIAKITKAMKMVSASKMKGDLVRLERGIIV